MLKINTWHLFQFASTSKFTEQKSKFAISNSSVNVTKSAVSGGCGHIYRRNLYLSNHD